MRLPDGAGGTYSRLMDAENFWADVDVDETEEGKFVPVLVMGVGDDADQVTRVPLAGEYELPEQARSAAIDAIAAMALEDDSEGDCAADPPAKARPTCNLYRMSPKTDMRSTSASPCEGLAASEFFASSSRWSTAPADGV
ncbi:hypothetical protein [Mitsuaria sp. GD03876]|uniref:hypothetical protein n=1 Tax=Mitsuaria sp. GD03876 TaxID=2975399 RepID=UPI00244A3698|nr:hypothetical protein [Mitsuaria sp. GD03876]MDH0866436.1 hypothetical protein [Mitsuaria sp. GD03876]